MTALPTPDPAVEKRRAKQAQEAYDRYLRDYLAKRYAEIQAAFAATTPVDVADLVRLKYEFDATQRLETAVLSDIDTGTVLQTNEGNTHD